MTSSSRRPLLVGLTALVLVIVLGLVLIFQYLNLEKERDLNEWRIRLGLIAETRIDAVDGWIKTQLDHLGELANNASLQLYLSQITHAGEEEPREVEPAQLSYLRNLILSAAERHGFQAQIPAEAQIPANLPQTGHAGLMLTDRQGKALVQTPHMPPADAATRRFLQRVLETARPLTQDIRLTPDQHAVVGFGIPVYAVQGVDTANSNQPIGVLYGVRDAEAGLFALLKSPDIMGKTTETLLVTEREDLVIYLSPLQSDTRPTQRRISLQAEDVAATEAVRTPGAFLQTHDYRGRRVLATSRLSDRSPWLLVQKIDAADALQESREYRRFLLTVFLLTLFFVAATLIAAWRHGSSLKAQHMAAVLRDKHAELESQSRLLHAVTDNVTDFLFLLDRDRHFLFANRPLANTVAIPVNELPGKTLASVLGADVANTLGQFIDSRTTTPAAGVLTLTIADRPRRFECRVLSVASSDEVAESCLVVLHDITELHRAQQKQADILRQTIQALVRAVDMHDPWSADHSSRTASVANAIAREMKLPARDRAALDMAAHLANVGKIFLPTDILTKTDDLTPEEHEQLKQHVQYSLDILSNLEFEGPVLETIAQKQEHMDGSGYPHQLSGDQIRLTARILAVANAFVAMVSPRAYRDSIGVEEALDKLYQDAGSKYDRQVVAALFHITENKLDWGAED